MNYNVKFFFLEHLTHLFVKNSNYKLNWNNLYCTFSFLGCHYSMLIPMFELWTSILQALLLYNFYSFVNILFIFLTNFVDITLDDDSYNKCAT